MPSHFSPKAKDLLKRIFQTDPMRRIKIKDIKLHPWMREVYPLTINIFGYNNSEKTKDAIDMGVLRKLMNMSDINFHGFSEDKVIDAIKRKKDYSFVIAYNMLLDSSKKQNVSPEGEKIGIVHFFYKDSFRYRDYGTYKGIE